MTAFNDMGINECRLPAKQNTLSQGHYFSPPMRLYFGKSGPRYFESGTANLGGFLLWREWELRGLIKANNFIFNKKKRICQSIF